jgi:hypothetical protein
MTKRELVARILAGPVALELEGMVHWFRLSIPNDRGGRCIVIALAPDYGYVIEDYDVDHAYAYLGSGKTVRLTQAEANEIAAFIRRRVSVRRAGKSRRAPRYVAHGTL